MTVHLTLKQLPEEERPRERLQKLGPQSISTAELMAIILGSGVKGKTALSLAHEILSRFGSITKMAEASIEELCQIKGLGVTKAIKLKAAFSLACRINHPSCSSRYKIEKAQDAYHLVNAYFENQSKELLFAVMLDSKSFVIALEMVAMGTLTQVLVHPREVFYPAVRHKAVSLLIAHNHPSGDPTPSIQDREITKTLASVGRLMNIPIQDHLIVTASCYFSFREKGLLI